MKKFLIIYIGRCGSSFLESLLNSHPNITCVGELLHPGHAYNKVKLPMTHNPDIFDDLDNYPSSPEIVFDSIKQKKNSEAYGFKLSIMHFLGNASVMNKWIQQSKATCIHIKRNLFDLYISMKLAQKNNVWTSENGNYMDYKIDITLDNFYSYVKNWEVYDQQLEKMATDSGGLSVSYEALEQHTQTISHLVIKHLNINQSHIFTSQFQKQKNKTLTEILECLI